MSPMKADVAFDRSSVDVALVRRLMAAQFPHWAELPVREVAHGGWDNRTFRLGQRMTARLPSGPWYALQVDKEQTWLPQLAPHLPLPIPVPLARGVPAFGYPWPWSVYRWLDGEDATAERIADMTALATTLADFLVALQAIDATGGPPPGRHNWFRGGPLAVYDGETRHALAALAGEVDTEAASEVWQAALATTWQAPPVWSTATSPTAICW
jgi:aminoglycoside phosphotransferase (APT) family kinase protein